MAIANFFNKICLSAAQTLQNFDRGTFESKLLGACIAVVYDENAASTSEGRYSLDLLVRMLSRLYPNLKFIGGNDDTLKIELESIAKGINPDINLSEQQLETAAIVIGWSGYNNTSIPVFYIGSNNWLATFSQTRAQTNGSSTNPFGAGAAACFAIANLFRKVFEENLQGAATDTAFTFSTFSYQLNATDPGPELKRVKLDELVLAGIGAIGNSVVWALHKLQLEGSLYLVDDQSIDLSNLQRYVMSSQDAVTKVKVQAAAEILTTNTFAPVSFKGTWKQFAASPYSKLVKTIALALDNVENRINAQGLLPKKIINAWTGAGSLGVSRHYDFLKQPCVCCLYMPVGEQKSKSLLITEALGLDPSMEPTVVRDYLANQKPIDGELIQLIVAHTSIQEPLLRQYEGRQLDIFYQEAICGGIVMQANGVHQAEQHLAEVPLVQESVLAGLFLAAELVIDAAELRNEVLPSLSKINLMAPISAYVLEPEGKHVSGRCICQDPIFQKVYIDKWVC